MLSVAQILVTDGNWFWSLMALMMASVFGAAVSLSAAS